MTFVQRYGAARLWLAYYAHQSIRCATPGGVEAYDVTQKSLAYEAATGGTLRGYSTEGVRQWTPQQHS